ncbi:MAG: hypothetical protein EHM53_06875 [Methanoregulaceae archaeon]|nr:MAG: hypothetical protein EHM53_06875 [Methanoregulaceae archaeon]
MRKEYPILVFALLVAAAIVVSPGSASILTIGSKTFAAAGETADIDLYLDSVPAGLSGYMFNLSMGDTAVAKFTGVTPPGLAEATWEMHGLVAPNDAFIQIWDSQRTFEPGATNVFLGSVRVAATGPGTTAITLTKVQIDGDGGEMIIPSIVDGVIQVGGSAGVNDLPSVVLLIIMVIGILVSVLLIQRTREH